MYRVILILIPRAGADRGVPEPFPPPCRMLAPKGKASGWHWMRTRVSEFNLKFARSCRQRLPKLAQTADGRRKGVVWDPVKFVIEKAATRRATEPCVSEPSVCDRRAEAGRKLRVATRVDRGRNG